MSYTGQIASGLYSDEEIIISLKNQLKNKDEVIKKLLNKIKQLEIETKTLPRIKIKKICSKCKKEFEVEEKIKRNGIIIDNSKKFCSRSCANGRIQTVEMNEKRRKKYGNYNNS